MTRTPDPYAEQRAALVRLRGEAEYQRGNGRCEAADALVRNADGLERWLAQRGERP